MQQKSNPFVEITISFDRRHLAQLQRLQNAFEKLCLKMDGTPRKWIRLRKNPMHLGRLVEYRAAIEDMLERNA